MSNVELEQLVPYLAGVRVESVVGEDSLVLVRAATKTDQARCPGCGIASRRVHSSYERRLVDPPIGGRAATIELTVRRFFCDVAACARRTFAEQVAGLTTRYARQSTAARTLLQAVALALGGRPGARLAALLAMSTGRMTMIRFIRALPEPPVATPKVLGIDDFALRRGHVYATILIDMTTRRPIDVLPDRGKDTVTEWLKNHPGVEVICRDRSGPYAEAANTGAPTAIQVADRWHLWRNLGEAVETVVVAHRTDLPEPTPATEDPESADPPAAQIDARPRENGLVTRTRERHTTVHALSAQGVSRADIARQLGLDPHTVRRFANAATVDELLVNTYKDTILDPYKPYLHQRWNDGCHDAHALFGEIQQQGFAGSEQTVRRYVRPFRATLTAPPAKPAPPKTRHVVRWIMTNPANLSPDDRARLDTILDRSPALASLVEHVRAFAAMMLKRTGKKHLHNGSNASRLTTCPAYAASSTASAATSPPSPPGSPSHTAPDPSKARSTASRRSSDRCTAAPTSTSSAAASSCPHDGQPITESVPEPNYVSADRRRAGRRSRAGSSLRPRPLWPSCWPGTWRRWISRC
jgi:transposase